VTTGDTQAAGRIVVGFDGSDPAAGALEWAAAMAASTGATVEVVTTWEWPSAYGSAVVMPTDYDPSADATRLVRGAVEDARRARPDVDFRACVVEGHPSAVLAAASRGADLLALGTRGHRELGGLLLGSVSEHCAAHASCPVLIFRTGG